MYPEFGILIFRLAVGGIVFAHGAQKLFGWWGGPGLESFTGVTGGHLRFRPPWFWGILGALGETVGVLFVLLGLLFPLGPAAIVGAMMVAITVHWPTFWVTEQGFVFALLTLVAQLCLALAGAGAYALDTPFGIALPQSLTLVLAPGMAIT